MGWILVIRYGTGVRRNPKPRLKKTVNSIQGVPLHGRKGWTAF